MARYLIVRGAQVDVPFDVESYRDTGFEFVGRPRTLTRMVVLHATGAENPPAAMYHNMQTKISAFTGKKTPLSVHFCVDQKGVIHQMADTETRCVHAGPANASSIGIEFICRGAGLKLPSRGVKRDRVTETIHGEKVTYDELLPAQIESGLRLVETLCGLYALPLKVPEDVSRNASSNEMSEAQFALFAGVCGHLHVPLEDKVKVDPGMRILRAVQARGRQFHSPVA